MTHAVDDHPNRYARIAGAIYLAVILFGGFSEGYVAAKLTGSGDAATNAHNIIASSSLWEMSLAGNLVVPLMAVAQLWIEYLIFRPAGRTFALLFVLFNIVSLAVESVSKVFQLAVAPILAGKALAGAFSSPQIDGLAQIALSMHDIAFNIALIFFGCACLISGHLIFNSTYLPRFIGVLMQVAGGGYLIASFSALFAPAISEAISPWILLPPLVGESSLCLWLLVKGVNVARWRAQLGRAG